MNVQARAFRNSTDHRFFIAAAIGIASIVFAGFARSYYLKPAFLIMIMARFHALIEHEPINADWVARLNQLSDKFRDLGQKAQTFMPAPSASVAAAELSHPQA